VDSNTRASKRICFDEQIREDERTHSRTPADDDSGSARDLRGKMTDVEKELWYHLRAGRMHGAKFRRQHPIPPYVVDFYCDAFKLVVELDGSQHGEEVDRVRSRFLGKQGLMVLRFSNDEVLENRTAVLEAIWNIIASPPFIPTPLPEGEGA
jgi:very-short-patch-repair endonuclease